MELRRFIDTTATTPISQRVMAEIQKLGRTSGEIRSNLAAQYPLQVYEFAGRKGVERVAYLKSHHTFEETKGKPTVVFFPGVFQEVREFPIELAIISRVFNIPSVVVDYAALASKGIDTLGKNLPAMLQCFERDRNAPRIFIGESLGGIVAQSVAEFPGMNVKGMVLSHTIPPSELNQRLYTFLKALSKVTPVVHMAVARRIINNIVQRAEGQAHIEGEVGELSRELHEVARILKGENGALTRPRAIGFLQSAVGAVEKGRRGSKPTNFPVEVAVNRRDQVVGYVDPDTWKRHHRRVSVTTLDDPAGHSLPGMRKAEYLSNTIGPLFANVLAAA